jgi:hypothetical protein
MLFELEAEALDWAEGEMEGENLYFCLAEGILCLRPEVAQKIKKPEDCRQCQRASDLAQ